jgi:hypothetical protein
MDIPFASRSKFLDACENAIRGQRDELVTGALVHVDLEEGGYGGKVIVTIRRNEAGFFSTDWEDTDPTRFPARIKAAATALLNCGCEGNFEISHSDGSLEIRAV